MSYTAVFALRLSARFPLRKVIYTAHRLYRNEGSACALFICKIGCAHKCTTAAHTLTYSRLPSIHQASCATCGYVGDWESHTTGSSYESDETHHWKECSTCNQQVDKEKHLFDEVLAGRVYMCVDCGYETDMPHDVIIDEEVS